LTTIGSIQTGYLKAAVFLVAGVFIFSAQDVIVKWISGSYPVHEIVLIRSISGIVPLLFLAHYLGELRTLRTRRLLPHVIRSFIMFSAYTCFYLSLAALPLAETVTLFFSSPLFITILSSIMLDEKIEPRCWIAVIAGFLGVALMLKPDVSNINSAALLAVMSAFCYALGSVITRKLGKTESGISMAFYPTVSYIFFVAFTVALLSRIAPGDTSHPSVGFLFHVWSIPTPKDLLWMLLLGLMAAVGFFCLSQAYRLAQPAVIAPLEYIAVPMSVVWGYIVWSEIPGTQSIFAAILIVASGLYILGRESISGARNLRQIFKIKIRR
jgi:drug/metabolite transporter (DMT)-like permease